MMDPSQLADLEDLVRSLEAMNDAHEAGDTEGVAEAVAWLNRVQKRVAVEDFTAGTVQGLEAMFSEAIANGSFALADLLARLRFAWRRACRHYDELVRTGQAEYPS